MLDGNGYSTDEHMAGRIWDAATGKPIGAPLRHHGVVLSAEYSLDGAAIVTASDDHSGRIWDARTGRALTQPLRHDDVVFGAQFDPTGTRVVTWSNDNTAQVWDAHTGERIGKPLKHRGWITSAQFSPDGTLVITGSFDCSAQIWNARTGEHVGAPMPHLGWVDSVAFSPDGSHVLTAADSQARADPEICPTVPDAAPENAAQIWMTPSGERAGKPMPHGSGVRAAWFSSDGTRVLTASNDGEVIMTNTSFSQLSSFSVGSQITTFDAFVTPPTVASVPEPASAMLLTIGLGVVAFRISRRRRG